MPFDDPLLPWCPGHQKERLVRRATPLYARPVRAISSRCRSSSSRRRISSVMSSSTRGMTLRDTPRRACVLPPSSPAGAGAGAGAASAAGAGTPPTCGSACASTEQGDRGESATCAACTSLPSRRAPDVCCPAYVAARLLLARRSRNQAKPATRVSANDGSDDDARDGACRQTAAAAAAAALGHFNTHPSAVEAGFAGCCGDIGLATTSVHPSCHIRLYLLRVNGRAYDGEDA